MKNLSLLVTVVMFMYNTTYSQNFIRDINIPVITNGNQLLNPWAGGLNSPQFSAIDLNNDGIKDLFVFEPVSGRVLTFINNGTPNQVDYHYAPQYASAFPAMHDWVKLVDYNCDGKEDVFTYGNAGITVYKNISGGSALQFALVTSQINTIYGTIASNLYVNAATHPGLIDMDGDGDLDVLANDVSGFGLQFHKNYSIENYGICDSLIFQLDTSDWGGANLQRLSMVQSNHGKTLLPLDNDGDGDIDLITDETPSSANPKTYLNYYENTGNSSNAILTLEDSIFPSYNVPAHIYPAYPEAYYLDLNNDNKKDLIVAPGPNNNSSQDIQNVLFYQNTSSSGVNNFNYIKNDLLVGDMIDVGTQSKVAFFDVDNDGLKDLILGNKYKMDSSSNNYISTLTYYRNTGSATNPAFTFVTDNFENTLALGLTGLTPAFGDLDGDGDEDMILGNSDGSLTLYTNTAGAGNPANFVFNQNNFSSIDVGHNSSPQIVDVNRDGLPDLLIGEASGNLNYYQNIGTLSTPVFSNSPNTNFGGVNVTKWNAIFGNSMPLLYDNNGSYELLVGSESGYLYHYNNIDGNLSGNFTLLDSVYGNIYEPTSATISATDINGDGTMDIAVGNYAGGVTIYVQTATAVNELTAGNEQLSIVPNPASDVCTIYGTGMQNAALNIYDLTGRLILKKNFIESIWLDVRNFSKGIFIVEVKNENGTSFRGKFVKD